MEETKKRKVILNKCFGGFGVSPEGYQLYAKKKGLVHYAYKVNNNLLYDYIETPTNDDWHLNYYTQSLGLGKDIYFNEEDDNNMLYLNGDYREDATLIEVVEELGKNANGKFSDLVVVEIPADMEYVIDDYDGMETLHQKVQVW